INNTFILKTNLISLFKFWYFPFEFIFFYLLFKNKKDIIDKNVLIKIFFSYLILIIIPLILNINFNSYLEGKKSAVGVFYSANDISSIISILMPFVVHFILSIKNKIISFIMFLLLIFVIFIIGTKTPVISLFICIVYFILKYIIKSKNLLKNVIIIISSIVVISLGSILISKTNFYNNLSVHMNYLGIDSIVDVFTDLDNIDRFIYSDRISFLQNKNKHYIKSSVINKTIGEGYVINIDNFLNTKLIELDYYDVLYSNGIFGFILYYGFLFYVIFKFIIKFYKDGYKKNTDIYILSSLLIIAIASSSGHLFTSVSASVIACVIVLNLSLKYENFKVKKKLIFFANDLRLGGIEKALINLLNNIDYNNYNVTLLLEHKTGEFILDVPNNVVIIDYNLNNNKNIIIRKFINISKRILFILKYYNSYDFSCCYTTYSLLGNTLAKIASKNNCLYIHSNYKYVYKSDEKKIKKFFVDRKINKYNKIIFVSNEAMQDLIKYYKNIKDKSIVISNFINNKEIIKLSNKKLNIKKTSKKLFVFVGRLDEESKKITRQISLAKNLDIDLWIIGDGPDKAYYEKLISGFNNIKLLGFKKNPYPYIKMADYIILTSDYEGYPVIYNEAIILNKKIITTVNISDEYINIKSNFGYIISKDEKKLVNEVKDILKNDKLKLKNVDFDYINNLKKLELEKIFNEVV
ncbi:MAG: O-antigen ligase family protein, partial [bacterium]|nr:O-antigen ligase family protein [bacterium]